MSRARKLCFEVLRSLLVVKEHVEHGDVVHGWVGGRHGYTCGVLGRMWNDEVTPLTGVSYTFRPLGPPFRRGYRPLLGSVDVSMV